MLTSYYDRQMHIDEKRHSVTCSAATLDFCAMPEPVCCKAENELSLFEI